MTNVWNIHLEPWIIEDGNYEHFSQGQKVEFALEFWTSAMTAVPERNRSCHARGDLYDVSAEVITSASDAWVIDFGLRAYQNEASALVIRPGDYVKGSVTLGVDPFFYRERLCDDPKIPPLIYSWKISSITMLSEPLVPASDGLRAVWVPDQSRRQEQEVEGTDCPPPDEVTYIRQDRSPRRTHSLFFRLRCELLDVPSKRRAG